MAYRTNTTCDPFRAWNRLEPRPRAKEFGRVLNAEIHDALWMLTRQWQFGEFKGEDTGSAVFAKVQMETTKITRFKNKQGAAVPFDDRIPLETRVERLPVPYDIHFRAKSGQYWLKLLKKHGQLYNNGSPTVPYDHSLIKKAFASLYPFTLPEVDTANDSTALQVAKMKLLTNKGAHQALNALSGRSMDGVLWYAVLKSSVPLALPAALTSHTDYHVDFQAFFLSAAAAYLDWFEKSHETPDNEQDTSWQPSQLEYSFACSAPNKGNVGNTVLNAEEFHHGHLDWYSFDIDLEPKGDGLDTLIQADEDDAVRTDVFTLIPSEAQFAGMPNSRWWEFEDGSTDFGNLTAETTNIAKILLAEFALMYSNDWFVIPFTVPAGSISEVKGIVITDTFGEKTLVKPAGQGDADDWTAWTMFNLTKTANSEGHTGKVDPRVMIPPAIQKAQESKPLEAVEMVRDEMANMVWGVENVIPDLLGGGQDGHGAAQDLNNWFIAQRRGEDLNPDIPEGVKLKYQLGNTVPENWIPFMPVHLPGQNRAIQLQRASMPRWFNDEFSQIRPRTDILRDGMRESSPGDHPFVHEIAEQQEESYFLHEAEVPRTGIIVEASWQRTRWYDGKIVCWYGRRKKKARGEGASGLAFDQVTHVDYENREALVKAEND